MKSASSGAPLSTMASRTHHHSLLQRGHPVQVRVHGDEGVEQIGQKSADDALADRLAGVEGHVLPHVGQVGRDQREVPRAQRARGARRQQQFDQLLVGLLQAAPDHHPRRQKVGQAQAQFAIRETMALQHRQRQTHGLGRAEGHHLFIVETQQRRIGAREGHAHQNSTNTCGTWPGSPRL